LHGKNGLSSRASKDQPLKIAMFAIKVLNSAPVFPAVYRVCALIAFGWTLSAQFAIAFLERISFSAVAKLQIVAKSADSWACAVICFSVMGFSTVGMVSCANAALETRMAAMVAMDLNILWPFQGLGGSASVNLLTNLD
jgi:hypothetical protein